MEKWRQVAAQVSPPGLPVDLVLAVMELESGGKVGEPSSANAAGLMQVKPSVVQMYNAHHKTPISFSRMLDKREEAGPDQIRVGAWLIGHHLRTLHKSDPDRAPWPEGPLTPWQVRAADLRYSHGPGAFIKLRQAARKAGFPDDPDGWREFQQRHRPQWTSEKPHYHAWAVWRLAMDGGGTRQSSTAEWRGMAPPPVQRPASPPRSPVPTQTTSKGKTDGAGGWLALAILGLFAFARK